ncbi:MAG: hypothetical protein H0T62_10315 [Parachlamydiaceae bacterium]|nr:hypothetical protein [Parachlamydiaceae bacterium]
MNVSIKEDKEILEVINASAITQKAQLLYASVSLSVQIVSETKEVHIQNNCNLFLERDESEESEDSIEAELSGYSYPDFSQHKSIETNALNAKIKFERICVINAKLEKFKMTLKDLSKKNQSLWGSLKDETSPIITLSDLIHFAEDDAFIGKFSYGPTKKGIMFCLANNLDGIEKFGTVSTHRKHNKSYKGVDKKFLEEFRQMVCIVLGFE